MLVFLSWSGEQSKALASAFNEWLQTMPLRIEPFFSHEDIESGARSMRVLDATLEGASYGLLFLTSDNLQSEWIHFEAGAMAKAVSTSRVVPLLFGPKISDVRGPLANFQGRRFAREAILQVCFDMNGASDSPVGVKAIETAFDRSWNALESAIGAVMKSTDATVAKQNKQVEPIQEVLSICRGLSSRVERIETLLGPRGTTQQAEPVGGGEAATVTRLKPIFIGISLESALELAEEGSSSFLRIYFNDGSFSEGSAHSMKQTLTKENVDRVSIRRLIRTSDRSS